MLNLPKSTEISKRIPKKTIYTKFQMNTALKEKLDKDIHKITLVNEITPEKINSVSGVNIKYFFVMHIFLKNKDYDESNILLISKLIPQKIIFLLEYGNESKLVIYHTKLIQTQWKPTNELFIELKGLNIDDIWKNIIIQIGNFTIKDGNTLEEQILLEDRLNKLKKEIEKLEKMARREKQPKKKFELVQKINKLKHELEV